MRCGAGHNSRLIVLMYPFKLCGCGEFAGPTRPTGLVRYRARTLQSVDKESKVGSLYAAARRMCGRKPWSLRCGDRI
ncbi:hypothetical protein Hamer_G009910 [Homarus americanus]|uniref:Uncharacterized protein n=1 Tax=Homarus americanus TaxID=6706 RepID=A0A8J5TNE8_HOMAM|nr:hypothetical protein Hamer_G009910 [Homarus americanus]